MNDKIDNLITQLKTEIEDYIQAEVAARSKDVVSFPETVSESSSISLPDFSAPTTEIGSTESSIGGKPMGESGIEAAPVEVSVPPMPTPTSLQSDLPIPAPDFSLPMDNTQIQPENLNFSASPAPVSEADFQMPTFVNSEAASNSSSPDAFNVPVTDLPLPGSNNNSPNSANEVSIDEALSNLPNLNDLSYNQNSQNNSSSSSTQNEPVLPSPFAPSEIVSPVAAPNTYDISEVTPQDLVSNDTAVQTDTTSPVLPESNFSASNTSVNSAESGFSKAKGLLSRVLQKEWGKK